MGDHDATRLPVVFGIDDLDDPRIEPFRNQRDAWLRARHLVPGERAEEPGITGTGMPDSDRGRGLFMAEGGLVVERLAEAHRQGRHRMIAVLVDEPRLAGVVELVSGLPDGGTVTVFTGRRGLLEEIVGYNMHRGVLALGEAGPQPLDLVGPARFALVLEDLANHDNVGSIFRSMSCLMHDPPVQPAAVLLTRRSCDPLYRKALRVSMGHALRVPWGWCEDAASAAVRLREAGFLVLGASPDPTSVPLDGDLGGRLAALPHPRQVAVVLGSEGQGLSRRASEAMDALVTIPQIEGSDSLNVSVAGALVMDRVRGMLWGGATAKG